MYQTVRRGQFIKKTKNGLIGDSKKIDEKIACRGFEIDENDIGGDCILIMGLNPAGEEPAADRERKNPNIPYFYSIPDLKDKLNGWHYPTYYKPIYEFAEAVFGKDKVNWNWCNLNKKELDYILSEIGISKYKNKKKNIENSITTFYYNHQKKTTIYIGDMFYYHETASSKLQKKSFDDNEWSNYYKEMLSLHIEELLKHNKTIKFIYFNNAGISHGYLNDKQVGSTIKTKEIVRSSNGQKIPIYFGSMLSGQHMMDTYSRARLIQEIKTNL